MAPKSIKKTVKIVEEEKKDDKKDNKKKIIGKGLEVKDNPDKIDKRDFDSNEEEEIDDIEEEENEESEVEEDEAEEAEEAEAEEVEEKEKEDEEEEAVGGDDECVYKITKKKKIVDIELDAVVEDTFEDDEPVSQDIRYVKSEDRITKPYLFEFERVRLLGERAKQISMGAKPMIKNIEKLDPKSIARLELENKVIPLMILRELPDGRIEKWKINELQ